MVALKEQKNIVAIEVDGEHNESLRFRPAQMIVRGRFTFDRVASDGKAAMAAKWNQPIPGQYIVYDLKSGELFIYEPLTEESYRSIRRQIEKEDMRIADDRQPINGVDRDTAIYWMRRAVEDGLAKVVIGELPEVDGEPQRNFIFRREPSERDRLAEAMDRQAAALTRLAEVLERK